MRFTPFFAPSTKEKEATIFGFIGDMLLTTVDTTLPCSSHFEPLGEPLHCFDIGKVNTQTFTLHLWDDTSLLPQNLVKTNIRSVFNTYPMHIVEALSRAKQLAHWLLDNVYCGRCGNALEFSSSMSALTCKACGHFSFPRLSPACIVLVTRGEEILLARSPHFSSSVYSLLAGFVEAGESAEACAKREVKEEVGIDITNLRYFGTQTWPFPHSLMIGFFAEYAGGDIVLQADEIEDAQWFTKENLPTLPYASSIACHMIEAWLNTKT